MCTPHWVQACGQEHQEPGHLPSDPSVQIDARRDASNGPGFHSFGVLLFLDLPAFSTADRDAGLRWTPKSIYVGF
jgi:hypothetical protein